MRTPAEIRDAAASAAWAVVAFFVEAWPSLLALVGCTLITAGIGQLLGRSAALILSGVFLLLLVGLRPLASLVLNGLHAVTETDDA